MYLFPSRLKIVFALSIFALILILIHIIILIIYFKINDPKVFDFVRMFDLDMERNIPTLFSSFLFAISSFLLYLLSKMENENYKYWIGLSIIFLFLSFDESAKIHEQIGDYTEHFVDATNYLYYPWFISYSIGIFIIFLFYFKFFFKMGKKTFLSFILSAMIFITGAIGFDILGANEAFVNSEETILYCLYYTIEESLEMFGLIYFISILSNLITEKYKEVK